jgi:hypothetical protein
LLILAVLLFIGLIVFGFKTKKLNGLAILKGFLPFVLSMAICGLLAHFGWKLLLKLYPGYGEILHGFTYNGHLYIAFFVAISLAITFWMYHRFYKKERVVNMLIAPLFFWLLICALLAFYLKGGSFFIVPVYFTLAMLFLKIKYKQPNVLALLFLSVPAIFILAPLIQFFPVGLGLKMLLGSAVFTVLIFGLLLPLLVSFRMKKTFASLFLVLGIISLVTAHFQSGFSDERHKPNSLVYLQNADTGESFWVTYDQVLDSWTENYLGDEKVKASDVIDNVAGSKYGTGFSYAVTAPHKTIPEPEIQLIQDSVFNDMRNVTLVIKPNRRVNRMALFADKEAVIKDFVVNGKPFPKKNSNENAIENRRTNILLSYYVSDGDSLEIKYSFQKDQKIPFLIQEMSFDLLEHDSFTIPDRSSSEMPKPFITTDAVILQKTIDIDALSLQSLPQPIEDDGAD